MPKINTYHAPFKQNSKLNVGT